MRYTINLVAELRAAEKRRANISGAYAVPDASAVEGKKILLIDDIVTTGSTLTGGTGTGMNNPQDLGTGRREDLDR